MASRAGGHGDRSAPWSTKHMRAFPKWEIPEWQKTRRRVGVDSLQFEKSQVAVGLVVGIVLGASSPAFPAPLLANIAAVRATATSDVVTVRCRGSVTARAHSCYDSRCDRMAKIDVIAP